MIKIFKEDDRTTVVFPHEENEQMHLLIEKIITEIYPLEQQQEIDLSDYLAADDKTIEKKQKNVFCCDK